MVVKTASEIDAAYEAAQRVVWIYDLLINDIRPGVKLPQIDAKIAQLLDAHKCKSCFYHYRINGNPPFPSHACLSVNSCIIHGTAGYYEEPLKKGDLLKVDIGVLFRGWIGDAAWTFAIGEYPSEEAKQLMACGKSILAEGIKTLGAGTPISDWAKKAEEIANPQGFHLCEHIGGHGYGRKLHESPHVSNRRYPEVKQKEVSWEEGQLVAVEPMVAAGTHQILAKQNYWPVFTADGSLAVHYEADVLISKTGPVVLTGGMNLLPDVVG